MSVRVGEVCQMLKHVSGGRVVLQVNKSTTGKDRVRGEGFNQKVKKSSGGRGEVKGKS